MLQRITMTLVVMALLCMAAFTLGGESAAHQSNELGIPDEHPIALALRFGHELSLSPEQIAQLQQMRGEMAKEFAPLRERAESIAHRMQELQQSGKQDPQAAQALQKENEELGPKVKALMDRYGELVGPLLAPEQREKLMKFAQAHSHGSPSHDFAMMFAMESREQLGITPQQFTKLQYLQADFIRAFAPLREQMELLQMEVQEKFAKAGKEPTPEYRQRGEAIQKQVADLQAKFSERAVSEVLQPDQRAKLGELLHDHN